MSKQYEWKDLVDLPEEELTKIKKEKQDELYQVNKKRLEIVSNILSLQGMIEKAKRI